MKIFYFDIKISNKIAKKIKIKHLKAFSDFSDFLLSIFCFLAFLFSFKNLFFIVTGWVIPNIIQKFITKERPYSYFKIPLEYKTPKNRSFPSSHTFLSIFIFFRMLEINNFFPFIILLIPFLRLISLQHWFSDIFFSIILSIIFYYIFAFFVP